MGTRREPHILETSGKTRIPRRVIFFDSEAKVNTGITDEEIRRAIANQESKQKGEAVTKEHQPYLICATYYRDRTNKGGRLNESSHDFYGESFLSRFWRSVDSFCTVGEKMYVFAHNAKYDMQVTAGVVYMVLVLGYTVTSFSDDNPFILKFTKSYETDAGTKKTKTIMVLSSTNYFQQSLSSLGKIFNLPKLDFDHDQEVNPLDPSFMERAVTYCRRDVEILRAAMLSFISFIQKEKLGKFSLTVAGQSFTAFLTRFLDVDVYIHADSRALDVERRAYAGGRNECFSIGRVIGKIHYLDINSMYPYVMKHFLYPTKLITFWKESTPEQVKEQIMDDKLVCCDCLIETDEPLFHVKQKKLIFPVGRFWTTLSTPEIIQAIQRGVLREVKNVCLYEAGDLFSGYVDYFYGERLKAKAQKNAVNDHLFKIFLNALYGKFGQKKIHWERIGDASPEVVEMEYVYSPDTRERKLIRTFGGGVFERVENEEDLEAFNSFPAVAAHVTAYARMTLWGFIETAGRSEVHYCDTDSVFVSSLGYERLLAAGMIDNKELGKLKLEEVEKDGVKVPAISDDLELYGCKDYVFCGMVKMKGISKNAVKLPDSKEGKLRFAVTQWGGFADRMRSGDFSTYHNKVIIKTLKRQYDKGEISGGRVIPFRLDNRAEAEQQARLEIETARKEMAAGIPSDYIKDLIKLHGYIRTPKKGERFFSEYTKRIPPKNKGKYFRMDKGVRLDEWADTCGLPVNELIERLMR